MPTHTSDRCQRPITGANWASVIAYLPLGIRRLNAMALTLAPLVAVACSAGSPAGGAGSGGSSGTGGDNHGDASPDVAVTPFEQQALQIAATYQSWGRIDDELRWAPDLCRIPLPGRAYVSGSDDGATHGQKLYSVFAKHRDRYPDGPHTDQVVVKQSWKIEAVTTPDASYRPQDFRAPAGEDAGSDHFYPYATRVQAGRGDARHRSRLGVRHRLDGGRGHRGRARGVVHRLSRSQRHPRTPVRRANGTHAVARSGDALERATWRCLVVCASRQRLQ